jgi:hypothetical protein
VLLSTSPSSHLLLNVPEQIANVIGNLKKKKNITAAYNIEKINTAITEIIILATTRPNKHNTDGLDNRIKPASVRTKYIYAAHFK